MGGACSSYGWEERRKQGFGGGNLRERAHLGELGFDGRIILRWMFRKLDVVIWTGSSWLMIGTGGLRICEILKKLLTKFYKVVVANRCVYFILNIFLYLMYRYIFMYTTRTSEKFVKEKIVRLCWILTNFITSVSIFSCVLHHAFCCLMMVVKYQNM